MGLRPYFPAIALGLGVLLSSPGCLSLGTRTTYVQESETTLARITTLEHRVNVLEEMIQPVEVSPGLHP